MQIQSGRVRKLETAIGILFLFHLVLIVVVLLVIQSRYDLSRFGVNQTAAANQQQAAKEQLKQVEKPDSPFKSLATGDFTPAGKAEEYNTDNLYEKIDGKAPMYQEVGFEKLTTQRFSSAKNSELGLEMYLYDMGNTKNAFSVYSRQKRTDVVDLNDFQFGYQTTNAIYISKGRYYIEMVGFAESQELIDAMKGIAKKLTAQLPGDEKGNITELSYFPPGTVAGSWKLQLNDAFGFDGLTDTYSAQYDTDGQKVLIFLSKKSNAEEAKKVAKSYVDFLATNGTKGNAVDSDILKKAGGSVMDFYGSTEIVFSAGPFVAGVHEADNKQAAEKAAEVLIDRLKKIND